MTGSRNTTSRRSRSRSRSCRVAARSSEGGVRDPGGLQLPGSGFGDWADPRDLIRRWPNRRAAETARPCHVGTAAPCRSSEPAGADPFDLPSAVVQPRPLRRSRPPRRQ